MVKGRISLKICAAALIGALLIQPAQALARNNPPRRDYHHPPVKFSRSHPPRGSVFFSLPSVFFKLIIGGSPYYCSSGVYYRKEANRYVVVPPPVGALMQAIPAGYQTIIVNGVVYYTADGVYYQHAPGGYAVVAPPVINTASAVAGMSVFTDNRNSFTVYIPRKNGHYTPVVLKRSGNGFTGPQGEFYPEFPAVEQLREMYAQ